VPGLTRRLLFAVLATLAPAVAASPAGAAGHSARPVTAAPNVGIVDIYTTLGYVHGLAAGTGMILTRSGEVLTNNHVIAGATKFKVVDVTTHRRYTATVSGYSVSRDIAVLQLANASGLRTIKRGGAVPLHVGMHVIARGNAQGRGGPPKTARGQIIALHQQIVAKDESGDSETLNNLIATNAPVVPGYSGGPLENSQNRVLGIVTAGSTNAAFHRGFAIPLPQALQIVRRIESGRPNANVHVGPTAFLGVQLQKTGDAKILEIVPGKPADLAGLVVGDVITSLNGTKISSSIDVRNAVLMLVPGKAVPIGWTDTNGVAQTGTITPIAGPPQ
jgi:S1-C subfamily serine protease